MTRNAPHRLILRGQPMPLEVERLAFRVKDACTAAGIGRTTLYKLAKEGRLRLIKVGGRTLIDAGSLRALISGQS